MTTIKGELGYYVGSSSILVNGKEYDLSERSKSFIKPFWQGKQVELTLKDGKVSFIKLSQTDTKGGVTTPLKQGSIAPPLSKEPIKDVQQLIIRQSCLSNAVKTYKLIINKSTIPNLNKEGFFTSIKKLADEYVDWVNGK